MTGDTFLRARDGRQRQLEALAARAPEAGAILFVSTNVPGARKDRPGLASLLQDALARLRGAIGLQRLISGSDALGPYHLATTWTLAAAAKAAALVIEAETPAGRLLDLDVYRPDGAPVDRAGLGLAPRLCLLCAEPARECMRLRRHDAPELLARVDELLCPWAERL